MKENSEGTHNIVEHALIWRDNGRSDAAPHIKYATIDAERPRSAANEKMSRHARFSGDYATPARTRSSTASSRTTNPQWWRPGATCARNAAKNTNRRVAS